MNRYNKVGFQNYSVLIIDDNPTNLSVIVNYLETYGFELMIARSGQSGLARSKIAPPDIILLDVMMPGIDGFETCRRLKANDLTREIPVIFMTALTNTEDKVKGFKAGAVDYVTKPIQQAEVLARITTHLRLRDLSLNLQQQAKALQKANEELRETIETLKATQKQLIESEKMAALGNLVAGVAHEINTPIGVGVTMASTLYNATISLAESYQEGKLKRATLNSYLQKSIQGNQLLLDNLQRAASLVQSFKQVAVDQTHLAQRRFLVEKYLQATLLSLELKLKQAKHRSEIEADQNITLYSYPGAFSQVVTNLVMNSIIHAYPDGKAGHLRFKLMSQGDRLIIEYSDDGCGMAPSILAKIFEPFFTTARHRGGTGLGLHIVYNLVTQKLKGRINCQSKPMLGTKFILDLPLELPQQD
jgi:signal transduction histidine kinase